MKMFSWIIVMQLLIHNLAFSQTDSLQKEINEQVWKPFIKAFNSGDNEAFSAVHSKDVIRVIQDNNQVMGYDQYFQKIPDSIKTKWDDWKKNIELRFLQRFASKDKAFEVGYYKNTSANTVTGEKEPALENFMCYSEKKTEFGKYSWTQTPMKKRMKPYFSRESLWNSMLISIHCQCF
jgi:ketosteroid isomerase-like protein